MQLPKGSTLGSYRIEDFVACSGMGEIYKARHTLRLVYQQADQKTILHVVLERGELREAK